MRNLNLRPLLGRALWLVASLIMVSNLASACARPQDPQQLRIVNSGSTDIKGLSVLFPGPTSDSEAIRVKFGDVAASSATAYQDIPGGVYRYAAYEYVLDGRSISQPVVDWVGERPMDGRQFTYSIQLDLQKPAGGQIQLVDVSVDTP